MSMQVIEPMAKKRPKAKPEPAPEEAGRKTMAVQVRASDEWKAWFEELAAADGSTLAALVERAARAYAKIIGFDKPTPKR